ncbi:MAG: hypothetical protein OMM_05802 [Candidatus Magnetoglobus multicellularis str. Araruama]|uniref:Uncharacterized protein n=1 Tax=Candidatus Magnetoglobus multicellularis str. Araruama TaxID=890399 RepID=A0A1V1NU32_9BACT|nr:MAG: hypothetical protein OMM_05802 [Candidatus Magnetoglobus multicellularis str. Araruama]
MFQTGEIIAVNFVSHNDSQIRPYLVIEKHDDGFTALSVTKKSEQYKQEDLSVIINSSNLENGQLDDEFIVPANRSFFIPHNQIVKKLAKVSKSTMELIIKNQILRYTNVYYEHIHNNKENPFTEGITKINYAGRVFDNNEMLNLMDASLEFWLTYGRFSKQFEKQLAELLDTKYVFQLTPVLPQICWLLWL